MRPAAARPAGRPINPELDRAILAAAEQQLGEAGYAGMSLESVATAAGTTVPAVRRRFGGKASMTVATVSYLVPAGHVLLHARVPRLTGKFRLSGKESTRHACGTSLISKVYPLTGAGQAGGCPCCYGWIFYAFNRGRPGARSAAVAALACRAAAGMSWRA